MPSRYLVSSLLLSSLIIAGCAGNSPVDPPSTDNQATPSLGATIMTGPLTSLSAPAIYRWKIDPATLTATSTLLTADRSAQDNDARFLLPLDNFLRPDSLRIERIRATADTLELNYRFTHPFASSEISNRADLGFSGFLLFLTDVDTATGNTFYNDLGDPVILNRDLITSAQAYWSPGNLLDLPGFSANTFPYRLIANEGGFSNRVNPVTGAPRSNEGKPAGNYDPANGWWTLFGNSDNWTGFDVLHQGQAAIGVLTLNRDALAAAGTFSLDVAVIAKYADPKSAAPGFEHRKPGIPPDVLNDFAYRYPYGALDVSRITWEGQTANFITQMPSTATLNFHIRDWDARATPTSSPIADVADPMAVPTSEVGAPNVFWSCPALFGPNHTALLGNIPTNDDSAFGGDPEQDSGQAGDGLFFTFDVERTVTAPEDARGLYPALVQFLDQGTHDQPTVFLDSDLQPITGDAPRNTTYWPFEVAMDSQIGGGWARKIDTPQSEAIRDIAVASDGQVWVTGIFNTAHDFGGGLRTPVGEFDCFLLSYDKRGNYLWDRTWGSVGYDDIGGVAVRTDDLTALVTGQFVDDLIFEGSTYEPLEADGFLFEFDRGGTISTINFARSDDWDTLAKPQSTRADLGYFIAGYVGFNAEISGTPVPVASINTGYTARLLPGGAMDWVTTYPHSGLYVAPVGITVLPSGAVVTAGSYFGEVDFGGGTRTSTLYDMFLVRLSDTGSYVWDRTFGGPGQDSLLTVTSGFGGRIVFAGGLLGPVDFGGGVHPVVPGAQNGFVVSLSAGGVYQWSHAFDHGEGGSRITSVGLLPGSGGDLILAGSLGDDAYLGSLFYNPANSNAFYARYDEVTGEGVYNTVFSSYYSGRITALTMGPEESFYYGLQWGASLDLEPGPGETILTADTLYEDAAVVKLFADNTW